MIDWDRGAHISADGAYRYLLHRKFGDGQRQMLFIMLNPSKADAQKDDPTIKRCLAYMARENKNHLRVINLFAYRATTPRELYTAFDPVGPLNNQTIIDELQNARDKEALVVCGWGAPPMARVPNVWFRGRLKYVTQAATRLGVRLLCLGVTKRGHPRHPLYLAADLPLQEF